MTSSDDTPILYSYYRSSCAYRVRIALNLKNIPFMIHPVNLRKGETSTEAHKKLNPKGEVPVLIIDGNKLAQSIPIIEYIDETHPTEPRILPQDPYQRYQARLIAEIIASGIQPLQNLCVLKRVGEDKSAAWAHDFIKLGLDALEKALEESAGKYCVGDQVTIADCCLVPQLYNARRFKVDLTPYPLMTAIDERLNELSAFKDAHPNCQVDYPGEEN
ncbi:unnamed protein product [Rotaria magnacalcarata]|uniref:maleylacetoacetate isomerase n=2 Tax=Rotaria magnacalcarata TaxID=392030 RepID=A0A816VNX8_9BILA|nr:unnamed protein product [Rotaria magnacalcarata]CAF1596306.1 unnamed protein product [Rotaria magnacalcarata]CAF2115701.1 unnamed protein product [Rotaria magnacalcarata]CAF2158783.1 unnamed protein product [Rotaria magnacalcarata]CAF2272298.1 unnamed protein product [Rotaria magnacalcarata]